MQYAQIVASYTHDKYKNFWRNKMKTKTELKPLVAAVGAVLATSTFGMSTANAEENPFQITEMSSGYMVAGEEGSCGEGKCGESKCGEGECGGKMAVKMMDKNGDGKISWTEWDSGFAHMDSNNDGKLSASEIDGKKPEGSCGEGKCGEDKSKEGSCGEGKCGS